MAGLPKELLDEMAAFACGIRNWDEWPEWSTSRANRLSLLGFFVHLSAKTPHSMGNCRPDQADLIEFS